MKRSQGRFRPIDRGRPVQKRRRKLPHWAQIGVTYFVTFRLWDSLPKPLVDALNIERSAWLGCHPKPWDKEEKRYFYSRFHDQVQRWLDEGFGSAVLQEPGLAAVVEEALAHFDGERYNLDRFAVMPTHVHGLVQPRSHHLHQVLHTWKSYTANILNPRLGRRGHFWMDETYDRIVRNAESLEKFRRYIEENPGKAGLQRGQYIVGTGTGIAIEEDE